MTYKQTINSCEFQSRCIQYKDMYSNKHIKCPIVDFALSCHGENKCKYKTVYEQLKAKEQECEKFKEENKLAKEIITKAVVDFSIEYGTKQYRRLLNGAKLLGIEVQDDR